MKNDIENEQDFILDTLAIQLAINHYNISVTTDNVDNNEDYELPGLSEIFSEPILKEHKVNMGFSRNILIVGAGASKNTYDFIKIAREAITQLHKTFRLEEILGIQKSDENKDPKPTRLWNKYVQLASNYSNEIIDENNRHKSLNTIFEEINRTLSFENNLRLLLYFFKKDDVINELNKTIAYSTLNVDGTRYLPSLFYETIAYLFKNRYIDVIINLNFDELLDNAIEDEMGEATYNKIIFDNECSSLKDIVDDDRLRIPIYIKPHGTSLTRSSMRFTNEHYIEISGEMKSLLTDIFDGKVKTDTQEVKRFNIIFTGYGIKDIDIKKLLFNHLKGHLNEDETKSSINYFIFDLNPKRVFKSFLHDFINWYATEMEIKKGRYTEEIVNEEIEFDDRALLNDYPELKKLSEKPKVPSNIHFYMYSCTSVHEVEERDDKSGLGNTFYELHRKIQNTFSLRFRPKELLRQKILIDLFPRTVMKQISDDVQFNLVDFLKFRARMYCLYELIKNKGRISITTLISGKIVKYESKYLSELHKLKEDSSKSEKMKLIYFLKNTLSIKDIEIDDSYITYAPFYDSEKPDKYIEIIAGIMLDNTYLDKESKKNKKKDLIVDLSKIIGEKNTYLVNAIYRSPEHWQFFSFQQEKYFMTNLGLSWKFYDWFVNRSWHQLMLITNTGKILKNFNRNESDLIEIFQQGKREQIFLVYTHAGSPIPHEVKKIFQEADLGEALKHTDINENTSHRIALFLRKSDDPQFPCKDMVPECGIYFIKNMGKMEINPIWFENDGGKDGYSMQNLKIIYDLFVEITTGKRLPIDKLTSEFLEIATTSKSA